MIQFTVRNYDLVLELGDVQEVVSTLEISPLPGTPDFVKGFMKLYGEALLVVDLGRLLGLSEAVLTINTCIIVIRVKGKIYGLLVDKATGLLRLPQKLLKRPPALVGKIKGKYLKAVGYFEDRFLVLLDLEKLFSEELGLHKTKPLRP